MTVYYKNVLIIPFILCVMFLLCGTDAGFKRVGIYCGGVPCHRDYPCVVWDRKNNRIILFGGSDIGGYYMRFNDLWIFNDKKIINKWKKMKLRGGSPSPIYLPTSVWDTKNSRMLMYDGHKNEMWAFNEKEWIKLNIKGKHPPSSDAYLSVWDTNNNRMIVWDCRDGNKSCMEMWSFNGERWDKLNIKETFSFPGRTSHTAVWDERNNRILLFGSRMNSELWSFDGEKWSKLIIEGISPSHILVHSAVWDTKNNRMLVFWRNPNTREINHLWSFNGIRWNKLNISNQNPGGFDPTSWARNLPAVWDTKNNRMILYDCSIVLFDVAPTYMLFYK